MQRRYFFKILLTTGATLLFPTQIKAQQTIYKCDTIIDDGIKIDFINKRISFTDKAKLPMTTTELYNKLADITDKIVEQHR